MKSRTQILEQLRGIGSVLRSGEVIASVRYAIDVTQKMLIAETFGGRDEVPGLKDARGTIQVVSGDRDLMLTLGELVLELEDGRRLPFVATNGDLMSGRYRVVGNGGFEEESVSEPS